MKFKLIIVFVEDSKTDAVAAAAKKSGARALKPRGMSKGSPTAIGWFRRIRERSLSSMTVMAKRSGSSKKFQAK